MRGRRAVGRAVRARAAERGRGWSRDAFLTDGPCARGPGLSPSPRLLRAESGAAEGGTPPDCPVALRLPAPRARCAVALSRALPPPPPPPPAKGGGRSGPRHSLLDSRARLPAPACSPSPPQRHQGPRPNGRESGARRFPSAAGARLKGAV